MAGYYRIEYVGGDWDKKAKVDVSWHEDGHRKGGIALDPNEELDADVYEGCIAADDVGGMLRRLLEHPDWEWG